MLKIEEALVKRGVIKHYNDTSNNTNSSNHYENNDKPKFWQKNRTTGNNDATTNTQNAKLVFNLTTTTVKTNQNENQNNNQGTTQNNNSNNGESRPPPYQRQSNRRRFTPLGQNLESTMREFITNRLITLPETRNWEPKVKPSWWNDADYCNFYKNKGHKTNDYMQLKHLIQDLIEAKKVFVKGQQTNNDHSAFTNPLPNYEKRRIFFKH